ncbi:MAG: hypothetical protein FWG48_02220 [Oscillospiraceae bacterium]|nr:hypothetical protein [Oscillospiraceae bacterium]
MPYIKVSVTKRLTQEQQEELAGVLGKAIALIPGKDGRGLIVDVEDGKSMYLGGVKQENMVFADVRYYSNFPYQVKKDFTAAAFDGMGRVLGANKDRMFLTITEFNNWGGFGDFKDEYYLSE